MDNQTLNKHMRSWTNEQWADAERVAAEITAKLCEDAVCLDHLLVLTIEELKRDPATTVNDVMDITILLGVESLLQMRHAGLKSRKSAARTSGTVNLDGNTPVKAKPKRVQKKGQVRGV